MQVMSPCLRPIFPGMNTRIGADKSLFPVGLGPFLIVTIQGRGIILTLIAKTLAKRLEQIAVLDEPVPIIMADLVAKMAQQGSVWLMHLQPALFPLGIVSFHDVNRDD